MWWHDLSLSAIQSKREWSAPSAETKTAMKRETKEHNSSGFNINLNFAQGNILCIYLHAQRQKRCAEHGGAEAENSSFNSPPTPMKKDCKGSVIPRGGGTSPTDNNPQGQRLAASKSVILFDVENMSLTITAREPAPVHSSCDAIFTPPACAVEIVWGSLRLLWLPFKDIRVSVSFKWAGDLSGVSPLPSLSPKGSLDGLQQHYSYLLGQLPGTRISNALQQPARLQPFFPVNKYVLQSEHQNLPQAERKMKGGSWGASKKKKMSSKKLKIHFQRPQNWTVPKKRRTGNYMKYIALHKRRKGAWL